MAVPSRFELIADPTRKAMQGIVEYIRGMFFDDVKGSWNGTTLQRVTVVVSSDGAEWTITATGPGVSDIVCIFNGEQFTLDATPAASLVLTAGTNAAPQRNYVYLTESGGTVSLAASTSDWPEEPYCAIVDVLLQSAASPSDTDGPFKVHAYTDHVQDDFTGHIGHFGHKFRSQPADWQSGCAAGSMTTSNPDAYLSCAAGMVFQLHPHSFPARDMAGGDPAWVTNFPGAANTKITSLDDINADSTGSGFNNKYINLVLWGVVNEDESDCKLMINLPSGSYSTASAARKDANKYANYGIGAAFVGTGFLIANYILLAKTSGLWVEDTIIDLRGQYPSQSPSGAGITDHGDLSGLTDDDHIQYALRAIENWTTLSLLASWVEWTAGTTPGYLKDNFGNVWVRGAIKSGTTTNGTVIATLPSGYRPSNEMRFMGNTATVGSPCSFVIKTNGDIEGYGLHATITVLDMIQFPTK